jgi:hypothetical protein
VKKIITKSYNQANGLLEKNRSKLLKIAKALLEKEVLDSEEIDKIAGVKKGKKFKQAEKEKGKKIPSAPAVAKKEESKEPKEIKPLDKPGLVKA